MESGELVKPLVLGYSQLQNEPLLDKIVDNTSLLYNQTMDSELDKLEIESKRVEYTDFVDWSSLQTEEIVDLCASNDLDGILFTKLIFINTKMSLMLIPLGQSMDTEVEMKYFDSNGNLMLHTRHNTANGNSYPEQPKAVRTIPDGVKGNLKRIFKEIEKQ
ncbi:MAG: hypothetical protein AAGC47_08255 [Bacteroidota bacterium]